MDSPLAAEATTKAIWPRLAATANDNRAKATVEGAKPT